MRLGYIFHGQDKEPHPFHVKSTWKPPIQRSVALESYLEEVKIQLAEIKPIKPKHNLPAAEQKALKALKYDKEINLKKADKGKYLMCEPTSSRLRHFNVHISRPVTHPVSKGDL